MKRVLIIIGDAGGGHVSAARALSQTFATLYPDQYQVAVVDILKASGVRPFVNSFEIYKKVNENRLYEFIYNTVGFITSTAFGYWIYKQYVIAKLYRIVRRIVNLYNPHLVIANNSIITPLVEAMKREGAEFKTVVLVTDIVRIFRGWADRYADLIISPTRQATRRLIRYGVHPRKIRSPLFPINPRLANFRPKEEVLKELGLKTEGATTILITSGGFGVLALTHALDKLAQDPRLQLIVLAGRIEELQKELNERFKDNPQVRILGFVENIQDYYNACDLVVGKPGPATIIEAELFQKKTVLTKRIGIQEKGNAEYAIKNPNFRYIGPRWWLLKREIDRLLASEPKPFAERRDFNECERIVHYLVKLMES